MSFDQYSTLGDTREVEPTFFFMLNCLLYSRLETGYPSNHDFYDEDVNMYLTNLLCSFMNPEYHRRAKKYISRYDANLFEKLEDSSDVRLKYTIYKTNADFLLISIGMFNEAGLRDPENIKRSGAIRMLIEPHHVASAVAFLCSEEAEAITGVMLPVDAGYLCAAYYQTFAGGVPWAE